MRRQAFRGARDAPVGHLVRMPRCRALLALLLLSVTVSTPAALAATRTGSSRNDVLRGTSSADKLYGRAGNDKLYGRGGNDRLYGGTGDDLLAADAGSDRLYSGPGADTLLGGSGSDRIYAADKRDQTDVILAGSGNDVVYARDGSPDRISCGPGFDRVEADQGDAVADDCEQVRRG